MQDTNCKTERSRALEIILVTETFPPEVNGVAMTNERLVRGLLARGHHVTVVRPRQPAADWYTEPSSENYRLVQVAGLAVPRYPGLRMGWPGPRYLGGLFQRVQPDVVHIATEGPLGLFALRAARDLGIPVTSTFHTNFHDYCKDYGAPFLKRTALRYLRWFHNACAATTVPDPALLDALAAEGFERLHALGRGADVALFNPARRNATLRAAWGADETAPVFLYVGRAAAEKNIPLAIQAFRKAAEAQPAARMVVVGDGPVRRRLEKANPDIHFAGMRHGQDLAAHYASADVFLFGSTSETFGNVVVEALASGLAVVTYDYAAGRQFIRSGFNGHLVPLGKDSSFVEAARNVLKLPTDEVSSIRANARLTAERYPWSTTIDRFAEILQSSTRRATVNG